MASHRCSAIASRVVPVESRVGLRKQPTKPGPDAEYTVVFCLIVTEPPVNEKRVKKKLKPVNPAPHRRCSLCTRMLRCDRSVESASDFDSSYSYFLESTAVMHAFLLILGLFSMANGQAPTIESDDMKVVVKVSQPSSQRENSIFPDFLSHLYEPPLLG